MDTEMDNTEISVSSFPAVAGSKRPRSEPSLGGTVEPCSAASSKPNSTACVESVVEAEFKDKHELKSKFENGILYGRTYMEVFLVRITKLDGGEVGQLHGTIAMNRGSRRQYLYKREREDAEPIEPGHNLTLTGPTGAAILAEVDFTVDVDLMNGDLEVSKGELHWLFVPGLEVFDLPLMRKIPGQHGSATIKYAVYYDAVQAHMEFLLEEAVDRKDTTHVYGFIGATNDIEDFADYESVVFDKEPSHNIEVRPKEPIQLSRPIVAVPAGSALVLDVNLFEHNSSPDSVDKVIAQGELCFAARARGTYEKNIGRIIVRVTWVM